MEEKDYLDYDESMAYLGVKRSTLFTLITKHHIPTPRFDGDKRKFIALTDVRRLKEIREKPWLAAGELTNSH